MRYEGVAVGVESHAAEDRALPARSSPVGPSHSRWGVLWQRL